MHGIRNQVIEIVAKGLSVDPSKIEDHTSFTNDLGADSLDLVELLWEFEQRFDSEISQEEAATFKTVGDVIRYIEKRIEPH